MLSKHARFFLGRLLEMWHHFSQSSANYATRSPATRPRIFCVLLLLMSCVRYYFTTHFIWGWCLPKLLESWPFINVLVWLDEISKFFGCLPSNDVKERPQLSKFLTSSYFTFFTEGSSQYGRIKSLKSYGKNLIYYVWAQWCALKKARYFGLHIRVHCARYYVTKTETFSH